MAGIDTLMMGSYWTRPKRLAVSSLKANPAKSLELRTLWRLYSYDTLLKRLPQDLQDVAAELRPLIQKEHAVVGQGHLAGHGHLSPADQPHIRDRVVRPATRWMRVVSMASGRGSAGTMVASRRANIDVPTPGGPRRSTLWAERLHPIPLCIGISSEWQLW
jgi:hypothetical protein